MTFNTSNVPHSCENEFKVGVRSEREFMLMNDRMIVCLKTQETRELRLESFSISPCPPKRDENNRENGNFE